MPALTLGMVMTQFTPESENRDLMAPTAMFANSPRTSFIISESTSDSSMSRNLLARRVAECSGAKKDTLTFTSPLNPTVEEYTGESEGGVEEDGWGKATT